MVKLRVVVAVLGVALLCGSVWAQETEKCDGVCPVAAAMSKLPKMAYKIGDETTSCSHSAAKLAEESGEPMVFVVAEKEYTDQAEAMTALAEVTEGFVNEFVTPSTCHVSGTTSLAGQKIGCSETAAKMAALVKEATDNVHMTYKVGEKECQCPNEAATLAKESGEKTQFVVGNESTCCSIEARINLARAKYRAAVEAIAKAQAELAKAEDEAPATAESDA
jgi:hypothetical protein